VPRFPCAARINYAGADELTPFVTGEPIVNDFIRALIHSRVTHRITRGC